MTAVNLRHVEVFVLQLQIGSFVPAESVRMHVFDSVFTRMGASDNLAMGRSTFLEAGIFTHSGCLSLDHPCLSLWLVSDACSMHSSSVGQCP